MSVEITGKALLFATIGMRKKETHADFYQVSDDLTLAEAADMLNRKLVVADSMAESTREKDVNQTTRQKLEKLP